MAQIAWKSLTRKKGSMVILSFDHFVNDFYSLFIPLFVPVLVSHFKIGYFHAGILVSLVSIIAAILQSPVGYLADRFRRRVTVISVGFLFFALGAFTLGVSIGFLTLILCALLIGIAMSTYHPQSTNLITKEFTYAGQMLGIHGAGGQLGRFAAPLVITFLISRIGWRPAAIILAVPAFAAVLLSFVTLDELRERGEKGFRGALTLPIILLIVALGLRGAVFQGIVSFLPSFLVEESSSLNIAGILTGVMLGVGLFAQPFGGLLGDRVSKQKIIFWSFLGLTTLFALLYLMMMRGRIDSFLDYGLFIGLLGGIGFCIFITFPVGLALSAELTAGERVGTSVGAVFGGGMAIAALSLPVTGHLIDRFGFLAGFALLGALAATATIISGIYARLNQQFPEKKG